MCVQVQQAVTEPLSLSSSSGWATLWQAAGRRNTTLYDSWRHSVKSSSPSTSGCQVPLSCIVRDFAFTKSRCVLGRIYNKSSYHSCGDQVLNVLRFQNMLMVLSLLFPPSITPGLVAIGHISIILKKRAYLIIISNTLL